MPQERRLVTILFADIVDSSDSVRVHDPEVVRDALGSTFARAREILVSHGGTVEKFIGDAIMAVFGMPVAHEDDAERAVRAALALRSGANDPAREALRFTFRIGIASGEVVSGNGAPDEHLVTGRPVVVAARLEEAAAPGEILVDPLTRELTRRAVDHGEPRAVIAKGIGVVDARPVVGAAPAGPREPRQGPFVGRAAELQLLADFLSRAVGTGRAHLVTLLGDAGVGKSRLVREVLHRTGTRSLRVTCLPYGRAITYFPLQEFIRLDAGVFPTDDLATAEAKIEAAVAAAIDEPAEVLATTRQLCALTLSGRAETMADDRPAQEQRHDLARALRRYVEGRTRGAPAIFVIEDLYWAEDVLLDLLDELLLQIRAPVLVVCVSRRELLDRRPSWGGGRANSLTVDLDPLAEGDSERLAGELLGDPRDPRIPQIVARTEGNPLYVEEYVRVLADLRSNEVPATLHGVIAARLDGAPPMLRRMLQEASVLGREFWSDALPGDMDEEARAELIEEALRRDLVVRSALRGPSGTRTQRFKHVLIRDVAYASLSKADRSRLHDHYAGWLAGAAGERAHDYAEIVLYHAERAFELAREVKAPTAPDLGRRAFDSLCRNASLAWGRADFELALELYGRAVSLAGQIGLRGHDPVVAQGMAAIARMRVGSDVEAIAELDRAIEAARSLGPTAHLVRLLTWRASTSAMLDDILSARTLYAEAVDVARGSADADTIAYALWTSGEPAQLIGQLREHRRLLEEALAHMRATGSDQWVVSCLAELSGSSLEMGETEVARAQAEEALAIAERTGRRLDRSRALDALARALLAAGDPRAREVAEKALALASEIGGRFPLAHVAEVASEALERSGERGSAESLVADALSVLDPERMPTLRATIARLEAVRARLAVAREDLDTAAAAAATAVRVAPRSNAAARAIALIAAASVSDASGRRDEARRYVAEAREVLAPTDHRLLAASLERLEATISAPR